MKIENIIKAKFRRSLAELAPILKRKLTPYQVDKVNELFAIASEGFFDSLDEILSGKEPVYFEDLTDDDVEDILRDFE